jgi:hypothetical protein
MFPPTEALPRASFYGKTNRFPENEWQQQDHSIR